MPNFMKRKPFYIPGGLVFLILVLDGYSLLGAIFAALFWGFVGLGAYKLGKKLGESL